ncbi:EscN/YscN/HrcN family type III secretion system ATPase [Enterobacterales bacterium CwR94]|nr:EscN/YscN/HrcN family type III secretion system ATPase [Enterobacterales bacterium CwR94]
MRQPDKAAIVNALNRARVTSKAVAAHTIMGKVTHIGSTLLRAKLTGVGLGDRCRLLPSHIECEIIAIEGDEVLLSPYRTPQGVSAGSAVLPLNTQHTLLAGEFLLGRIVNGLGELMDNGPSAPAEAQSLPLHRAAPDPLSRALIDTPLPLGIKAIDGMLTCGKGQRMGIFAPAGGGKSTLLGMIAGANLADVTIIALIGERGREVREFIETSLTPEARERAIIVVATSDRPALERMKAAYVATTLAEYFRDRGQQVLLMMDSLTRFARAIREIGFAAGEKITSGGYPVSLYSTLPLLLERAGPAQEGSITGLYTVLVEGDDLNEPVSDEVRSILDGHIVLSRKLAEAGHYPAIDIAASVSRVMSHIVSNAHAQAAMRIRELEASYREIELLVRVGEYQRGQDPLADEALARHAAIQQFLSQSVEERAPWESVKQQLLALINA